MEKEQTGAQKLLSSVEAVRTQAVEAMNEKSDEYRKTMRKKYPPSEHCTDNRVEDIRVDVSRKYHDRVPALRDYMRAYAKSLRDAVLNDNNFSAHGSRSENGDVSLTFEDDYTELRFVAHKPR